MVGLLQKSTTINQIVCVQSSGHVSVNVIMQSESTVMAIPVFDQLNILR